MQTLSPTTAEESGLLSSMFLEELEDEPEDLTIRRVFEPKRPARVEVEVSDADATWKWERPAADSKGRFLALALPTLEDERALEFDHSEVEVTREMMSPFALSPKAAAIPLAAARRRTRRIARPQPRPSFVRANAGRIAGMMVVALAAFVIAFFVVRPETKINLGMSAGIAEAATTIELPPLADVPLQGTIVPTAKGHRLYVDGKLLGDSDGPVTVDCGTRIVKLGSSGASKSIAVPCGGEIKISP